MCTTGVDVNVFQVGQMLSATPSLIDFSLVGA